MSEINTPAISEFKKIATNRTYNILDGVTVEDLIAIIKALENDPILGAYKEYILEFYKHLTDTNNPHQMTVDQLQESIMAILYSEWINHGNAPDYDLFKKALFEELLVSTPLDLDKTDDEELKKIIITVKDFHTLLNRHEDDSSAHTELIDSFFRSSRGFDAKPLVYIQEYDRFFDNYENMYDSSIGVYKNIELKDPITAINTDFVISHTINYNKLVLESTNRNLRVSGFGSKGQSGLYMYFKDNVFTIKKPEGSVIPGTVVPFSGSFGGPDNKHPIPEGSTEPDLGWVLFEEATNRFIRGSNAANNNIGEIGGVAGGRTGLHSLNIYEYPYHNHFYGASVSGAMVGYATPTNNVASGIVSAYLSYSSVFPGNYGAHDHAAAEPPYYTITYIKKIPELKTDDIIASFDITDIVTEMDNRIHLLVVVLECKDDTLSLHVRASRDVNTFSTYNTYTVENIPVEYFKYTNPVLHIPEINKYSFLKEYILYNESLKETNRNYLQHISI